MVDVSVSDPVKQTTLRLSKVFYNKTHLDLLKKGLLCTLKDILEIFSFAFS